LICDLRFLIAEAGSKPLTWIVMLITGGSRTEFWGRDVMRRKRGPSGEIPHTIGRYRTITALNIFSFFCQFSAKVDHKRMVSVQVADFSPVIIIFHDFSAFFTPFLRRKSLVFRQLRVLPGHRRIASAECGIPMRLPRLVPPGPASEFFLGRGGTDKNGRENFEEENEDDDENDQAACFRLFAGRIMIRIKDKSKIGNRLCRTLCSPR
jgi:hypothetical protein